MRTILILPAFIVIVGLFQWAGSLALGLDPLKYRIDESPVQETIGALFTLTGTIVIVGIFRRFIDKESFKSMGFYCRGILNETLFGLGLGALIMATGFVALVSIREINWLGLNVEADNIILGFGLFVLVALTEELLLRGYVLNNLMKSMNHLIALAVSGLMFALIHVLNLNFSWLGFWNIFLAGILLRMPYNLH